MRCAEFLCKWTKGRRNLLQSAWPGQLELITPYDKAADDVLAQKFGATPSSAKRTVSILWLSMHLFNNKNKI